MSWRGIEGALAAAAAGHDAVLSPAPDAVLRQSAGAPARYRRAAGASSRSRTSTGSIRRRRDRSPKPARAHPRRAGATSGPSTIRTEERVDVHDVPARRGDRGGRLVAAGAHRLGRRSRRACPRSSRATTVARHRLRARVRAGGAPATAPRSGATSSSSAASSIVLSLEDDAPLHGERAVFLVDIMNPCWIYADADLSQVDGHRGRGRAGAVQLPDRRRREEDSVAQAAHAEGELEVRIDGCDGEKIATLPLAPARQSRGHGAAAACRSTRREGRHDLCFTFTQRQRRSDLGDRCRRWSSGRGGSRRRMRGAAFVLRAPLARLVRAARRNARCGVRAAHARRRRRDRSDRRRAARALRRRSHVGRGDAATRSRCAPRTAPRSCCTSASTRSRSAAKASRCSCAAGARVRAGEPLLSFDLDRARAPREEPDHADRDHQRRALRDRARERRSRASRSAICCSSSSRRGARHGARRRERRRAAVSDRIVVAHRSRHPRAARRADRAARQERCRARSQSRARGRSGQREQRSRADVARRARAATRCVHRAGSTPAAAAGARERIAEADSSDLERRRRRSARRRTRCDRSRAARCPARLRGVIASRGLAVGRAVPAAVRPKCRSPRPGAAIAHESAGARSCARGTCARSLERLAATRRRRRAKCIAAHLEFLDDWELVAAARRAIARGKSAASRGAGRCATAPTRCARSAIARMRERVDDLLDLESQVLLALDGKRRRRARLPRARDPHRRRSHALAARLARRRALAGICTGARADRPRTSRSSRPRSASRRWWRAGRRVLDIAEGTWLVLDAEQGSLARRAGRSRARGAPSRRSPRASSASRPSARPRMPIAARATACASRCSPTLGSLAEAQLAVGARRRRLRPAAHRVPVPRARRAAGRGRAARRVPEHRATRSAAGRSIDPHARHRRRQADCLSAAAAEDNPRSACAACARACGVRICCACNCARSCACSPPASAACCCR